MKSLNETEECNLAGYSAEGTLARDIFLAMAGGAVFCGIFLLLFPGKTLSYLTHHLLHLPGPGSAIAVIVGPLFAGFMLVLFSLIPKPKVILAGGCTFSILHSFFVPLLNPGIKTAGSVGSPAFRILALLLAAIVLEICIYLLRGQKRFTRYWMATIGATICLSGFYWNCIFPLAGKGWVDPLDGFLLLVVGLVSTSVFIIPSVFIRLHWTVQ